MLAVILGLVFVVLGFWGVVAWWVSFKLVLKGLVPAMILCGGLLSVIAGIASIKDAMASKETAGKEPEQKK